MRGIHATICHVKHVYYKSLPFKFIATRITLISIRASKSEFSLNIVEKKLICYCHDSKRVSWFRNVVLMELLG